MKNTTFHTKIKSYEFLLISIIVLVCVFLISILIKNGHNWGDDFSLYISETKALIDLDIHTFYETNKYAVQHSRITTSPYLTPLGFPILLTPIYYIFGFNLVIFKIFCAFFLVLCIPVIYYLFKKYLAHPFYTFFILIFIAFHPQILKISDNIISDFPFLFFCLLSLYLMTRKNTFSNQIALGFTIFFSFLIRDIGIVLLPTLITFQLAQQYSTTSSDKKNKIRLFTPYLTFILFIVISSIIHPQKGENQLFVFFSNINFTTFLSSLLIYKRMIISLMYIQNYQFWLILLIVLIGVFTTVKQTIHFSVFFCMYFFILLFWNTNQGVRFILPLIPIFLFFLIKGSYYLFEKFNFNPSFLILILSIFLLRTTKINFIETSILSKEDTNQAYTPEMNSIYKFITENIKQNETIGFFKYRALRLNTNYKTIGTNLNFFPKSIANYLLIRKSDYKKNNYLIILNTKHYLILKKRS